MVWYRDRSGGRLVQHDLRLVLCLTTSSGGPCGASAPVGEQSIPPSLPRSSARVLPLRRSTNAASIPAVEGAVKSALDVLQGSGSLAIASAAYALIGTELVMTISEWYRAKRFAEGKAEGLEEGRAEGRVEGRAAGKAEAIKTLRAHGYEAAAEALEARTQAQDAPPQSVGTRAERRAMTFSEWFGEWYRARAVCRRESRGAGRRMVRGAG